MTPIKNNQNNINSLEETLEKIKGCYWIEYGEDKEALEILQALITTHEQQAVERFVKYATEPTFSDPVQEAWEKRFNSALEGIKLKFLEENPR